MGIEVEARGFSGRYRSLNARRSYPVGLAEVVMRSITVGGIVRGSRYQRSMRRSSIANMVLSSIASRRSSELTTTELYEQTETTEKTGVSFRLGMAFAAVAASRVLMVNEMKHVRPRGGGGGRRADLVGMDRRRRGHVMEAKSRTYGIPREVVREAKTQARATAAALAARGVAIDTRSACVTDLSGDQVYVLIEDPPPSDETDLVFEWSDEEFFADYYSPVPDLLSVRDPQPSGIEELDEECVGAWLPGAGVWLGLDRRLVDLGAAGRLWRDAARARTRGTVAFEEAPRDDVHRAQDGHALAIDPSVLDPTRGA